MDRDNQLVSHQWLQKVQHRTSNFFAQLWVLSYSLNWELQKKPASNQDYGDQWTRLWEIMENYGNTIRKWEDHQLQIKSISLVEQAPLFP